MINESGIVKIFSLTVLLFLLASPAWSAEYFKYRDENGAVHFVDRLDKVPAQYRDQLSGVDAKISTYQSEESETEAGLTEQARQNIDSYRNVAEMLMGVAGKHKIFYIMLGELIFIPVAMLAIMMVFGWVKGCFYRWALRFVSVILLLIGLAAFNELVLLKVLVDFSKDLKAHAALMEKRSGLPEKDKMLLQKMKKVIDSFQAAVKKQQAR